MITAIVGAGLTAGFYFMLSELKRLHTAERETLGFTIAQPPNSRRWSAIIAATIFVIEAIYLMAVL